MQRDLVKKIIAGLVVTLVIGWWVFCLPRPLFNDPLSAVLFSQEGRLLAASVAEDQQWRFRLESEVPKKFIAALLCAEDRRFYWHAGVDPLSVVRSIYQNISRQRVISGASTITMQTVRLFRRNQSRSMFEKVIESLMALSLEFSYSKKSILELYASHAPMGGNVVGLEAAAWKYFGRTASQLSWAESALLAVLPNNPSLIRPGKNHHRLKVKRDRLLDKLHQYQFINPLELSLAKSEPIPSRVITFPKWGRHCLDTLVQKRAPNTQFHSTLDYQLQIAVSNIVQTHSQLLQKQKIKNAAALVIDNQTSEVKAYVGNSVIESLDQSGYAMDLVHRPRSTGSVLKPFLYACMLKSGEITPLSLIADVPTQFGPFSPENFDRKYRGAVSAQMALSRSLNVPAVRMLNQFGVARFYDALKRWGMSTLHRSPDGYGLTLIIGGAEGTLWDMAQFYSNLAYTAQVHPSAMGVVWPSLRIDQSETKRQTVISDLDPGSAWLTAQALIEVNRPDDEVFWKQYHHADQISWKTGTSHGQKDGWAIGFDARHTVAVWVGNANGEGNSDLTGIGAAAPLLFDVFNRLGPSEKIPAPSAYLKEIDVCKENGYFPFGGCKTIITHVPADSQFDQLSGHHQLYNFDPTKTWRVHSQCQSVSKMVQQSWFTLPPAQEYYYRRHHADYRSLPPYRADCADAMAALGQKKTMEFIYPNQSTQIYIPIELNGSKGRTVFEVAHRSAKAIIHWHLDEVFLGTTKTFHQQALDISPGKHKITLVDQNGVSLSKVFEVLSR